MITDKGDYLEFYERDPDSLEVEDWHQVVSVGWVKYNHPELLFWHTVNEGKKTITAAIRDEQAGLLKGVSDFSIVLPNGMFAAIELKRTNKSGKGKASPVSGEQKAFLRSVRDRGGFAAVAYGFEQFKIAVEYMLNSTNS